MVFRQRSARLTSGAFLVALAAATALSGCTSHEPKVVVSKRPQTKEYFPESIYGKASPRMTNLRTRLPRGGGRDQVGKPYKVAGKWYYPKEQPGYSKKGKASWYGDAFHGRLTANGEIYDMTHLSAAHPTMPLPSYARVTNLKNGSSVVVRVNDRGPFAHGRVIDLSSRAAEMLDYKHSGIADVRVDYVGRAPLEGQDDNYLLASYTPGRSAPGPSDGLASGVMIAMAGPTPTGASGQASAAMAAPFPGQLTVSAGEPGTMEFPENGPIIADRPLARAGGVGAVDALGYAETRAGSPGDRFAALTSGSLSPAQMSTDAHSAAFVSVGTFADRAEALRLAGRLATVATASIEEDREGSATWYTVTARPSGEDGMDAVLEAAWRNGATDAFVVRN